MAGTLTSLTASTEGSEPPLGPRRRPFRDNPRLILTGIAVLVIALVVLLSYINRSQGLSPDYLAEFVLYALIAADLSMVVALVFVLARNIVKLVVERQRGGPFVRFRSKLVALLIGMTLIPAMLVLAVGSELIRTSVGRWFNVPVDEILSSANAIAADYYEERQSRSAERASHMARALSAVNLAAEDLTSVRALIEPDVNETGARIVQVYRIETREGVAVPLPVPVLEVGAAPSGTQYSRALADRLAGQALASMSPATSVETFGTAGDLLYAASAVWNADGVPSGVVVSTDLLDAKVAARSRRMTQEFENYNQLRVIARPLTGVYLLFFLMVTLTILVGATWMGLYLAKRITQPVQRLAAAAREIGAGHLDQRIEPQSDDEFGSLTEAFNTMASELATSRLKVEQSTIALERRRRYVETVLERIATGVISITPDGRVATVNGAASRLLGVPRTVVGEPARAVFNRPELEPIAAMLSGAPGAGEREFTMARDGRETHLAVVSTPLTGDSGDDEGYVLVFDDVTPLVRAQRVAAWREVARRLAHEIKNPLTPIQLSAERLKRHFTDAPSGAKALVDECTGAIVSEVESLKGLVDEFSQFARMPAPRTSPTDIRGLVLSALALYDGLFTDVVFETAFDRDVPLVRIDPEQIRRVVINVVDNAIEAVNRKGHITIEISNTTPLPAKIYANEGIAQVLFLEGDTPCETTYKDKRGKYQGQTGITLPRILK